MTEEKASHTAGPCYASEDCACQVLGDGTERNPFDINYCAKHAAAAEMLKALEESRKELIGASSYLATCDPVTIVQNLDSFIASLKARLAMVETAIRKAKGGAVMTTEKDKPREMSLPAIEKRFEAGSWDHADLVFLYARAKVVPELLAALEALYDWLDGIGDGAPDASPTQRHALSWAAEIGDVIRRAKAELA